MLNNERVTLKQVNLNLDILPAKYRRKHISFRQIMVILGVIAGALLLVLLYQIAVDVIYQTSALQAETEILNAKMQLKKIAVRSQSDMKAYLKEFDSVDGIRGIVYDDVIAITEAADQVGVEIDSIDHDGTKVVISCPSDGYVTYSEYRSAFEGYYQALLETEMFATVERAPTDWMPSTSYVRIDVSH